MKINFSTIKCRPSLKSQEVFEYDISQDLGDSIYQNSTNLDDYPLAVRIFDSQGEATDVTDDDLRTILKHAVSFPLWVQAGIIDSINAALAASYELHEESHEICEVPSERIFEEPVPGAPAPDGGVYAGEGGSPAQPEEPIVEVHETVPQTEVVLEDPRPRKTTSKTKKK